MQNNIFDVCAIPHEGEIAEDVLKYKNVHIKRIVSSATLKETTFCQKEAEWVVLLQGNATLLMNDVVYVLEAGDYLFIPALQEHTIQQVQKGTLWLAIHIYDKDI